MTYKPETCWASVGITEDTPCPQYIMIDAQNCGGGFNCRHRKDEEKQCENAEETAVGLCLEHFNSMAITGGIK